jgi:hypothetical protein
MNNGSMPSQFYMETADNMEMKNKVKQPGKGRYGKITNVMEAKASG